uniref:Cytochrome c oxidase subunit 2 n=1 Tax=Parachtes romandiolae TaxID=1110492 RepID=A0A516IMA9_9ARAC|nr:cytochrome c oxidase subunit II [Parachtes romandiolae]QDP17906.1 cytochrome c oxidase subunit 2 [Parachtes romandiolae]
MPVWCSMYFQNSVSLVMEQLLYFHDYSMIIMLGVMITVGYFIGDFCLAKYYNRGIHEGQKLEGLWTVLPGLLLLLIVFPSLKTLYFMEESDMADMSIKVMAHQWYWEFEYFGVLEEEIESYMKDKGVFRLLEVDNWLLVPFGVGLKIIVSSFDVIHSWTIPAIGLKVDAVPGRLNQLFTLFNRPGTYIGQCSEICGANHSFMPISMGVLSVAGFFSKMM